MDTSKWVSAWFNRGLMWTRSTVSGRELASVADHGKRGAYVSVRPEVWAEDFDAPAPNPPLTLGAARAIADREIMRHGFVLLDRTPAILLNCRRVLGPWHMVLDGLDYHVQRDWLGFPAVTVRHAPGVCVVWLFNVGNIEPRRPAQEFSSLREAMLTADQIFEADGWEFELEGPQVIAEKGLIVPPEAIDESRSGSTLAMRGGFGWAAEMVGRGYIVQRKSKGAETMWHYNIDRTVNIDDAVGMDWAVVGRVRDLEGPDGYPDDTEE